MAISGPVPFKLERNMTTANLIDTVNITLNPQELKHLRQIHQSAEVAVFKVRDERVARETSGVRYICVYMNVPSLQFRACWTKLNKQ